MPASVHDYLRQRKFRRQKRKLYFFGSLAAVTAIAVFYFIFFSGIFSIRDIAVEGAEAIEAGDVRTLTAESLAGKSMFVFPHDNIFLFSSRTAAERIRAAFPRIEEVSIKKRLLRREIAAMIRERQPAGVACADERCAYFDARGIVFDQAPVIASASLLRIEDSSIDSAHFPQEKYPSELVEFVIAAKKEMQEKAHATIVSFSFMNGYGDVEARTQEGYTIFLNTGQGAKEQAQIFKNIIASEIKDRISQLEYIDLRVENRAYYKMK